MEKREPPSYVDVSNGSSNNTRNNEKRTISSTPITTTNGSEGSSSRAIPVQTRFASVSLHASDLLRLLEFPDETIEVIKQAIRTSWPSGLQDQRYIGNCLELKLRGRPWMGPGAESMHARRLMRQILHNLFDAGWVLSLSTDISKYTKDKDTLIFRHQNPPPKPRDWICVAFSKKDRLRLMDAPEELTKAMYEGMRDQIQELVAHPLPGVWEAKLNGWPWQNMTTESTMNTKRLLLRLFAILDAHGFTVYASIDQKADVDREKSETDTWHCCRPKDWEAGVPVYHA